MKQILYYAVSVHLTIKPSTHKSNPINDQLLLSPALCPISQHWPDNRLNAIKSQETSTKLVL